MQEDRRHRLMARQHCCRRLHGRRRRSWLHKARRRRPLARLCCGRRCWLLHGCWCCRHGHCLLLALNHPWRHLLLLQRDRLLPCHLPACRIRLLRRLLRCRCLLCHLLPCHLLLCRRLPCVLLTMLLRWLLCLLRLLGRPVRLACQHGQQLVQPLQRRRRAAQQHLNPVGCHGLQVLHTVPALRHLYSAVGAGKQRAHHLFS